MGLRFRPLISYLQTLSLILIGSVACPAADSQSQLDSWRYFSYVNWKYNHRDPLVGWKVTSDLLEHSLRKWGIFLDRESLENGNFQEFTAFQKRIQNEIGTSPKLVYLASHQTAAGRFDFIDEQREHWTEGFLGRSPDPALTIVLLDVCHADVIPKYRYRKGIPFDLMLSAAAPQEETYEVRMFSKRGVDFQKRYPEEVAWMKRHLGSKWEGQVSFLGFVWVHCYLQTREAPESALQWEAFFERMSDFSKEFATRRSRRLASQIRLWKRDNSVVE
ncbi:MAG: hypothetical protein AAF558_03200 [Verrucomicrobiota bacterium]